MSQLVLSLFPGKRAEERFGIQLTKQVRREIISQIPVIYSKSTKAIVTVLPISELQPSEGV